MRSFTRMAATAWLCLVMAPAAARAQASIAGVGKDTSGAVLPGVTVEASSPALIEKVRVAVTDGTGQYKIVSLVPGLYTVTFTLTGFQTFRREGITPGIILGAGGGAGATNTNRDHDDRDPPARGVLRRSSESAGRSFWKGPSGGAHARRRQPGPVQCVQREHADERDRHVLVGLVAGRAERRRAPVDEGVGDVRLLDRSDRAITESRYRRLPSPSKFPDRPSGVRRLTAI